MARKTLSVRKIKYINMDQFCDDVLFKLPNSDSLNNITDYVNVYNNTLREVFDNHAPLITKTLPTK